MLETTTLSKKSKYNELEHAKLVGEIISRMSSNHTKWLFALFTIIGFSLSIDKFILEINGITKIVAWCLVSGVTLSLQVAAMMASQEYYRTERAYREKQKRIFEGKYTTYDMRSEKNEKTEKWSWIIIIGWIVVVLYLMIQIILIFVNEYS